jgi:hypothetical protein
MNEISMQPQYFFNLVNENCAKRELQAAFFFNSLTF